MSRKKPALLAVVALLLGCGEEPRPAEPQDGETPSVVPADEAATPDTPAPESSPGVNQTSASLARPAIPTDVFFDDPLAIVQNKTRIRGAAPPAAGGTAVAAASAAPPTPGTASAATAAKEVDWAEVLPAETLVAEVQRIRERIEPKLENVASFNNSYLEFPAYAAELAALAEVAARHPGDIPWKPNAKHVRELAGAMNGEQLTRGNKSYEQVKGPFDKVVAILDGKPPADLPEAEDEADFSATADFGYLMRRLESGQNFLNTNGSSEPAFKQTAPDIVREGRVLAALAAVVTTPDYGYGEDPKFQQYTTDMRKAGGELAAAAQAVDFAKFDLTRSALLQSCTQCHGEYRN